MLNLLGTVLLTAAASGPMGQAELGVRPVPPVPARLDARAGGSRSGDRDLGLAAGSPGVSFTAKPQGGLPTDVDDLPPTWEVTIDVPETGFTETFLVQAAPPKDWPAPLLVVFHGFGHTPAEIQNQTTYELECAQRGWFFVAPLGASTKSFSSLESQINVETVLELVTGFVPGAIDPARIYGIGFSMGGGNVLNYAARHLDPTRPMFAAVVNHTGSVDLFSGYWASPGAQWIYEFWFGGSPLTHPFEYLRSSVIQVDPMTLAVDTETDLARNLTHVPVRSVYATADPLSHLVIGTQVFASHLLARGGTSELVGVPAAEHAWETLDETEACDWLAAHSLKLPASADTLADHDGPYFHFVVDQQASGAFTPFTWKVSQGSNRLILEQTANLAGIQVDTVALGLDPDRELRLELETADGWGDEVTLLGYQAAPASVLRDGVPSANWSWNVVDASLKLQEGDGALHAWTIRP